MTPCHDISAIHFADRQVSGCTVKENCSVSRIFPASLSEWRESSPARQSRVKCAGWGEGGGGRGGGDAAGLQAGMRVSGGIPS